MDVELCQKSVHKLLAVAEGRVANFLLGTSGILNLWLSFDAGTVAAEDFLFLVLIIIIRLGIEFGIPKETIGLGSSIFHYLGNIGLEKGWSLLYVLLDFLPILALSTLVVLLYFYASRSFCWKFLKHLFITGNILSCILISVYWILESNMIDASETLKNFGQTFAPRIVYSIGLLLVVLLALLVIIDKKYMVSASDSTEALAIISICMLSALSPTIIILLGRQGPYVALVIVLGVWCLSRLKRTAQVDDEMGTLKVLIADPTPMLQWNLLAVCLFFCTGHRCSFDGLRFAAAFIGFEHFNKVQQGILLVIDTFGVSHIVPVLTVPFLVISKHQNSTKKQKGLLFVNLTQAFLLYGLMTAVTTTLTMICVAIQRRHLMVWSLFAPKYVFDVLGLLFVDALICLASLFYY